VKDVYSSFMGTHLAATECHLPYEVLPATRHGMGERGPARHADI